MVVVLLLLLAGVATVAADCPIDCPAACPEQSSIVVSRPDRQKNFSLEAFFGTYYQLQYHDNTQPQFMSCMQSIKSSINATRYKDLFSLHLDVVNFTSVCDLFFDVFDQQPGVFLGHWAGWLDDLFGDDLDDINNTVIDVGPLIESGQYKWTLEFQCKDNVTEAAEAGTPSGIDFAAINFYHSDPLARADIPEMTERVRELGLGWIMDLPELYLVDQQTCVDDNMNYPSPDDPSYFCGQRFIPDEKVGFLPAQLRDILGR